MNSQLFFEEYLLILKSSVEVYVHGTLESSNDEVRKVLKHGLDETMGHQARVYDKMCELGWYFISNVKSSVVHQTINKIKNSES